MSNNNYTDPVEVMKKIQEDDRYWPELTPAEQEQIHFKLDRAIFQLIFHFPFFGFMATRIASQKVLIKSEAQFRGEMGAKFKTMATDGKKLYIWPQYVLYNDVPAIMGVVMHELFHIILLHIGRGQRYNQELANISMDFAVNMMVNDLARELAGIGKVGAPDERSYRAMSWYVGTPPGFYDEKYRDPKTTDSLLWEKIYEDLLKQQDPNAQKMLNSGSGVSEATGGGGLQGVDPGQGMTDSHDFWNPNNRPADEEGNVNQEKFDPTEAQNMIRDAAVQAANAKMRGHMPASMERLIQEWLHPPLPWQRLVQNYLKPADGWWGYQPGDTRFEDPLPWFIPDYKLRKIVIAIDTSGSMSDQEVASSIDQARHLLRGFPQTQGILCMCDAEVGYWEDIKETYTIKRRVGYGGTSFHPPFQKVVDEKLVDDTDLLIYFTDGYGAFPDRAWMEERKIGFDTIWVITNNDITPPEDRQYRWTRLNPLVATPGNN